MAAERGEFRGIYTVIVDGPDFVALTPNAKLLWFELKLALGQWGLVPFPAAAAVLSARTRLPFLDTERAYQELTETGWVECDGSLVWMVRGLEFEPSVSPENGNHRQALRKHLAGLPSLPIVARFRARYTRWFVDEVPSSSGADGMGMPPPSHGDGISITETDDRARLTETETSSATAAREAESSVPITREAYAQRCTVACNRGLRENTLIRGRFNELVSSGQLEEASTWFDNRVSIEVAEQAIYDRALEYKPAGTNRQPRGLRYFRDAVTEAAERATGRSQERRFTPRPRPAAGDVAAADEDEFVRAGAAIDAQRARAKEKARA